MADSTHDSFLDEAESFDDVRAVDVVGFTSMRKSGTESGPMVCCIASRSLLS